MILNRLPTISQEILSHMLPHLFKRYRRQVRRLLNFQNEVELFPNLMIYLFGNFWLERLDQAFIRRGIREYFDTKASASFFIGRRKVFAVFT
ncbi:MAG: hypothetical protein A2074_05225 [Candidatus Aquicultor primus]|uniref:Uncharacterized protein n=1 Tax=Candidatus Aquicultor primus TaxID=1797195 RepID=A0A1F2UH02_9ACTN|nr:MAG: hypothetical protein A2074_05225 [Candidatus Aquicultor primus]